MRTKLWPLNKVVFHDFPCLSVFISFLCLIALAGLPNMLWNWNGKRRLVDMAPVLGVKLLVFCYKVRCYLWFVLRCLVGGGLFAFH